MLFLLGISGDMVGHDEESRIGIHGAGENKIPGRAVLY